MLSLVEVLRRTERFFRERGIPSPRLDAELLLGHVLELERVALYLQFDRPLDAAELERLRPLVRRRGNREPLAWVIGHKAFYDLDLLSPAGVLVPRPDTETLVEAALALIPDDEEIFVADIGSGTGAVGLAIAGARPKVKLFAVDLSPEAVAATRDNAKRLGLSDRVAVLRGSLLEPVPAARRVDFVVSNPPYIPTADLAGLAPEVRDHEPRLALDGGVDGLHTIRLLVPAATARARRAVLLEVGDGQAEAVSQIMVKAGLTDVAIKQDLAGKGRVVLGRAAGSER